MPASANRDLEPTIRPCLKSLNRQTCERGLHDWEWLDATVGWEGWWISFIKYNSSRFQISAGGQWVNRSCSAGEKVNKMKGKGLTTSLVSVDTKWVANERSLDSPRFIGFQVEDTCCWYSQVPTSPQILHPCRNKTRHLRKPQIKLNWKLSILEP